MVNEPDAPEIRLMDDGMNQANGIMQEFQAEHVDDSRILAYLQGALSLDERQRLENHLRACKACQTQVATMRRLQRLMRHHYADQKPSEQLWQQVCEQIEIERQRKQVVPLRQRAHLGKWRWVVLGGMAASVLFAVQVMMIQSNFSSPALAPQYQPMGAHQSMRLHLWVRFAPEATTDAITMLLRRHGLKLNGGPDAQGRYRVALPADADEQALQALQRVLRQSDLVVEVRMP